MTVALRNPSKVGNLISVDNAPIDAALKSDFGKYIQGMRQIEDTQVSKQAEADYILQKYEEVSYGRQRKDRNTAADFEMTPQSLPIRQFLLTNLVRVPGQTFLKFRIPIQTLAASLDNMADFPFKDPDAARYEKPTLFLRGTRSHYVADDVIPLIGRLFPRFELKDIDSGHWVISENPEAFRKGEWGNG